MTVVAVIADTHLPRGVRRLPEACVQRLRGSDLILHAGDVMTDAALRSIEAYGPPVLAVRGNVDDASLCARLPAERVVEVDGARIAMVHDAGPARGRMARLRTRFPDAHAAVFGHSHLPLHAQDDDGFQIFNPGSPTQRRRAPAHTMGLVGVRDGRPTFALTELA